MIIDQVALSGDDAYLRTAAGGFNLAVAPHTGQSIPIGDGIVLEVAGLSVVIDRLNILDLLERQPEALLEVEVTKEMFPGLYRDPYSHRVHRLGGFEDFSRGELVNLRVLEVDGTATLVSDGGADTCLWTSAVYRFPKPVQVDAAAWEMPSARLTPSDAFEYKMQLRWWRPDQDPAVDPPQALALAADATPVSPRFLDHVPSPSPEMAAYQVVFEAAVKHDAYLRERFAGSAADRTPGRPLLNSVNLLEVVAPAHKYYSLQEIVDDSASFSIPDHAAAEPHRVSALLAISATLTRGESIKLSFLHPETAWTYLSARLRANLLQRPPRTDQEG